MGLEAKKLLLDVLTSCEAIQEFTAGKSFPDYEHSRLLRSATERKFEVIGEALGKLRRLDGEVSTQISSLDAIVAFRHRIIHGYDSVDDVIVWNTIQKMCPSCSQKLKNCWRDGRSSAKAQSMICVCRRMQSRSFQSDVYSSGYFFQPQSCPAIFSAKSGLFLK
jgi:uncharacterized protein with HEPN domain